MPTVGQLALLGIVLGLQLAALPVAVSRLRQGPAAKVWQLRALLGAALLGNALLWLWRASARDYAPPRYGFDSAVLFTTISMLVVGVLTLSRRLRGVELFFLPVIALFQAGAYLMRSAPEEATSAPAWFNAVHPPTMVLGAVFFALGCSGAGMYLMAAARLRRKQMSGVLGRLPSLETSERLSWIGVSAGFALLTFGILAGLCLVYRDKNPLAWLRDPKLVFVFGVWLAYLALLLIRLAPRFRGRWAAKLTIASFALLAFAFVVTGLFSKMHR